MYQKVSNCSNKLKSGKSNVYQDKKLHKYYKIFGKFKLINTKKYNVKLKLGVKQKLLTKIVHKNV